MKIIALICLCILFAGFVPCRATTKYDDKKSVESTYDPETTFAENTEIIDLIKSVYDQLVFAVDCDDDEICNPKKYFTDNALKKLRENYEFDCVEEPCYAYYALRTDNQDSNPNSDGVSEIQMIDLCEDGWYIVSYLDMGWTGKTRIKVINGKIDDYMRILPYNKLLLQ